MKEKIYTVAEYNEIIRESRRKLLAGREETVAEQMHEKAVILNSPLYKHASDEKKAKIRSYARTFPLAMFGR